MRSEDLLRQFRWPILFVCLFLVGCVGPLVRRGDTYAGLGQWVQAVDAYSRAHQVSPHSNPIEIKLKNAREQAVLQEVGRANEALESGALKVAWKHAAKASRVHPNDTRVKGLRKKIRDLAAERVREFVEAQNWSDAFVIWHLLKRHDSGAALVEVLSDEIAHAMVEQADVLQHELRYWEARALLLDLGKRQPARAREMEIRVQDLQERWVVGMRSQSLADERAGRLASALIRASVAAGLSDHRDDHERRQRLKGVFLKRNGVIVGTQVVGDRRRVGRMLDKLDSGLSWNQVVRWVVYSRKAELAGRIVLERPVILDSFALRSGTQSYVAGHEDVPNPDYQKRLQSIGILAGRLDQTNRMIGSLEGEYSIYHVEIVSLEANIPELEAEIERIRGDLANANVEMSRAKEALREAQEAEAALQRLRLKRDKLSSEIAAHQQRLAELAAQTDPAAASGEIGDIQKQLNAAQTELANLQEPDPIQQQVAGQMAQRKSEADLQADRVRTLQEQANSLTARLSERTSELQSSKDEQQAVRQELNDLIVEYSKMYRDYGALLAEFGRTPETVTREIKELFHYEIQDWTRTCEVVADLSGVRPTQSDMQQVLRSSSVTHDATHPAHRRYGVGADLLRYPKSKIQLIDDADAKLQRHIRDWLKHALSTVRANRISRAQRSIGRETDAAATDFLVAWMLSPRKPPAGFDAFIVEYYGNMDLEWLEVRGQ